MQQKELDYLRDTVFPAITNAGDRVAFEAVAADVGKGESAGRFTAKLNAGLSAAVESRSSIVRSHACRWLFRFAAEHDSAADLVRTLFASGSSACRLSLVQSIAFSEVSVEPVERAILSIALQDKASRIRIFAADRVLTRGWKDMVPQVEAAADSVAATRDRDRIRFSSQLLRDGYSVETSAPGDSRSRLLVKYKGGTASTPVPANVLSRLGPAEVARCI